MSDRHHDEQSRPGDTASYSLDELSNEADVTPRTIRYYIAEGLLPPPESAGRNARYTQEHLDRLRLIAQMKEQFLPLKEIRRRIHSSPHEHVTREPPRTRQVRAAESRRPRDLSPAQDYVAHALEESNAHYAARQSRPRPDIRSRENRRAYEMRRSWKRIPISDDAELLITNDAWERRGEQIEAAIDWIRRMLNE
jgi:DNA-binding transcriptional MerR regulator